VVVRPPPVFECSQRSSRRGVKVKSSGGESTVRRRGKQPGGGGRQTGQQISRHTHTTECSVTVKLEALAPCSIACAAAAPSCHVQQVQSTHTQQTITHTQRTQCTQRSPSSPPGRLCISLTTNANNTLGVRGSPKLGVGELVKLHDLS
jgi:hypothetical protein